MHYFSFKNCLQNFRHGFTFVEMAIVLIVIALLIGGVLTGTEMLRNAEIRTIMSDKQRYVGAIDKFQSVYHALPGDMHNATSFWGAQDADPVACRRLAGTTAGSVDTKTCDGDGDDSIYGLDSTDGPQERIHEIFRMWQHLSNAGLLDGIYAGVNECDTTGIVCFRPGWNAPNGAIRNSTWTAIDIRAFAPFPNFFYTGPTYGHVFYFGSLTPNTYPTSPVITPREMWSIDDKFDDGLPASGNILAIKPIATGNPRANNCATTSVTSTARYNMNLSTPECMLVFLLSY